jgi:transposase
MTPLLNYIAQDFDAMIGIDVAARTSSLAQWHNNSMTRTITMPSKPDYIANYISKVYPNKRVLCAYEAGPTGFGLHDYLIKQGIDCIVISASSLPKPANSRVKTNRIDAQRITLHLKNGEAKPIRVPEGAWRGLRELIRSRESYAKLQRTSKQRIKSLLLAQSLNYAMQDADKNWSGRYISQLKELECTDPVRKRLLFLMEDLVYAKTQNARALKELRVYVSEHSDISRNMKYLMSIPGIGFITAVSVLGNIGDPSYLNNPRELGCFAGLVPSESSTGDDVKRGSITHLGNTNLRVLLIEASWTTIRKDSRLCQFYHRIRLRHPANIGPQKAITAVARKLTMIIYRVLKDQRDYIPY